MRLLELELVTPELRESYRVSFLSLEDTLGSLGIYPGHERFLTTLPRSVGYFLDERGKKKHFAYDHGFLRVDKNRAFLLSRIIVSGKTLEELREELERKAQSIDEKEKEFRKSIENLEKMILKKIVEAERV